MMKKELLGVVFGFLILLIILMAILIAYKPQELLPASVKKALTEMVGIDVWRNTQTTEDSLTKELSAQVGLRNEQLAKPVTQFVSESAQKIDGHILSRGYDYDGFERVMLRGQFTGWRDVSLLADSLGRRAFGISSAGQEFVVYVGKTVKLNCVNKTFYDKNGVPHDLTKVMVEYDKQVDEAPLVGSDKVVSLFTDSQEMAVVARYTNEVFEALMLVGYDCTQP